MRTACLEKSIRFVIGGDPSFIIAVNRCYSRRISMQCIQDQSPRHPVEACIHPDNKQRNRYANIQCCEFYWLVFIQLSNATLS